MRYRVEGMSCAACSARVEKAVLAVEGVTSCSVNLLTNSMEAEGASQEDVIRAVEQAGYKAFADVGSTAVASSETSLQPDKAIRSLCHRLIASCVLLAILMYVSMGHTMWGWPLLPFFDGNGMALGLLQLLLSAAVMVINQHFFISGFKGLLRAAPNMDTLVSLGSAAAFGYSTAELFIMTASPHGTAHPHFYFESAAMILTLITVGKLLEARSKGKTTDALKALMDLAPKTATVVRGGVETTVPVERVIVGDEFVVRPGEHIPVDGVVLEGAAAVDESALTGESIPVDKGVGDTVCAATTDRSGFLRCRATRVGEDTTLSSIVKMVSDAAASKAPIAKTADKVSGIFVPIVLGIGLVTTVVWLLCGADAGYALSRGISVLVISCPCALGLATPVAIMVGSGIGAKHGVLFKSATALEQTGRTRTVILDKTGTITKGQPRVTSILTVSGVSEEELLSAAVSLEAKSEHPLASAVLLYGEENAVVPEKTSDFSVIAGCGLQARVGQSMLYGGNAAFIAEHTSVPSEWQSKADELSAAGQTVLFFAKDAQLLGAIAVADVLKEDSKEAVRELKELGLRVVMLTGDHEKTARAVAASVGIEDVVAGVRPDGKEEVVRSLGDHTLMVGDGINDAPALTRACVGMAIGAGTDVAIDAADVVLVNSRLSDAAAAVRLSRAVLRTIRQNLFWAFIYNVIGIPLAAGVWIPLFGWEMDPMFGAAAMSLSSFCVVTNALRLNRRRMYAKPQKATAADCSKVADDVLLTKTMIIQGMMCGHCSARVKTALEALDGVQSAQVSYENGKALVTLSTPTEDALLKEAVTKQGYKVVSVK